MSDVKKTLRDAYELLEDHGANPAGDVMRALSRLIEAPEDVPTGALHLQATIAPGGVHKVTDQHGREVHGVKSVAMFEDRGKPVFQVNL